MTAYVIFTATALNHLTIYLFKKNMIREEGLLKLIATTFLMLITGVYIAAGAGINPTVVWLALSPVVYVNLLGYQVGGYFSLASALLSITINYSFDYYHITYAEWSESVSSSIMKSNLFFAPFILYLTFVYYAQSLKELIAENSKLASKNEQLFRLIMHDIKNPLLALEGAFNRNKRDSMELHISYIKQVLKGAKEMALKNQYAEKSDYSYFDLVQIKAHIQETFQYKLEEKGISLVFHGTSSSPQCWGHFKQFSVHVINNIISNAIKYSPPKGQIDIFFDQDEAYGMIKIKDQGNGIDPQLIEKIRNEESIASQRGTLNEKGNGFGLRIALDTIISLDGEIEFEHDPAFKVCIKLPLKPKDDHHLAQEEINIFEFGD